MIRTTTPTHVYTFPVDPSGFDEMWITYVQKKRIVLEKYLQDLTVDSVAKTASFTLTQQESAAFVANALVEVQIKVRQEQTVMASDIYKVSVQDVLNPNFMGV